MNFVLMLLGVLHLAVAALAWTLGYGEPAGWIAIAGGALLGVWASRTIGRPA